MRVLNPTPNMCAQAMYDFHRKDNVVISVDLIRLQLPPTGVSLAAIEVLAGAQQA